MTSMVKVAQISSIFKFQFVMKTIEKEFYCNQKVVSDKLDSCDNVSAELRKIGEEWLSFVEKIFSWKEKKCYWILRCGYLTSLRFGLVTLTKKWWISIKSSSGKKQSGDWDLWRSSEAASEKGIRLWLSRQVNIMNTFGIFPVSCFRQNEKSQGCFC